MTPHNLAVAVVLATVVSAGCASTTFEHLGFRRLAGGSHLSQGIAHYEEGNYRAAARRLQFALEEGLSLQDRVTAHKYLAFISCVSGQQTTCREEFAIALNLDPKFMLSPAESGHPIWGPVFKSAKAAKK